VDLDASNHQHDDPAQIYSFPSALADLLRNMLDMNRVQSKQLTVENSHVDIKSDIFESVASMLYRRENNFVVQIDCPESLVVITDRLRMKQICLNLARNSLKFVDKGFIRLRASVLSDGPNGTANVHIYIEDSGPGIPVAKRGMLFMKWQQSLDSLQQGTGIGLCLCKRLLDLMGGELLLDESYDSGVAGCPGARFDICLNASPVGADTMGEKISEYNFSQKPNLVQQSILEASPESHLESTELPMTMSVLFVDDDTVLRKLFRRSVKTVAANWKFNEASSGETAVRMVDTESFD